MLLSVSNISKSYGSLQNGNLRTVLNGVSLHVSKGESLAILGPSGSGKTTLLNIVGTLDAADSGTVVFEGSDISTFTESQRDLYRNTRLGFIFQLHHLLPQCTLLENVLIPCIHLKNKATRNSRLARAIELMKRVGLYEQRDQKPGELSGGECQRTAVIRAMINSPEILLADEPSGALDEENAERLAELMLEINRSEQVALIVVTHSLSLANKMGSVYELKKGLLSKLGN
jgi:lipoprotein-releasing system ATP-binding protein